MPSARHQPFEDAALGRFPVEMKHLRIKLMGKLDDLLLAYWQGLRFKARAYFQIFKIALVHKGRAKSIARDLNPRRPPVSMAPASVLQ